MPLWRSPSAIVARGRVLACDTVAAGAGVQAGQKLSTALGLLPGLAACERDAGREARALAALACWAGRFTPTVSLRAPDAVLLEIGGCLRLFGNAQVIVDAALAGCAEQTYSVRWAVAPTPLAAYWLARAGMAAIYADDTTLRAALDQLSCSMTGWPAEALARLESFGLRRLGDLNRLPSSGLRRRLGNAPVEDWLRARGEIPDPQLAFVFPERFAERLELPSRVEHAEALAFAGQRLLSALAGWLRARQRLVRHCSLQLAHDDGTHSELPLRLGEPCADEGRLLRLLREHLARLQLVAPVEAIGLRADEVVACPGDSSALFATAPVGEGRVACLERLRARLGEAAVRVVGLQADHRPECATRLHDPQAPLASAPLPAELAGRRPLWLLPEPEALNEQAGVPRWHGPLQLMSRPERLESGWWDEGEADASGDLRRDYFVACNPRGQWAWIFRDAQGWYLHGLFA